MELNAIKEGLLLLQTLQIDNIVIETDCLEAIACINDVQGIYIGLQGILHDIKHLMATLQQVVLKHTSRNCNKVAH